MEERSKTNIQIYAQKYPVEELAKKTLCYAPKLWVI